MKTMKRVINDVKATPAKFLSDTKICIKAFNAAPPKALLIAFMAVYFLPTIPDGEFALLSPFKLTLLAVGLTMTAIQLVRFLRGYKVPVEVVDEFRGRFYDKDENFLASFDAK